MIDNDIMTRSSLILQPDPGRTVIRPFSPEDPQGFAVAEHPRAQRIADRVLAMDAAEVEDIRLHVTGVLTDRHSDVETIFLRRFEELRGIISRDPVSQDQALLIGACFSAEYSFEAAALFNPSIVLDVDQTGLPPGSIRFSMSLRGIGEGHVSSVTFRTGVWAADGTVAIDTPSAHGAPPTTEVMRGGDGAVSGVRLRFAECQDLSETVIFPITPSQRQGIEDLRLVRFTEDDGSIRYHGTYTAFSGADVRQELLSIHDYQDIEMRPLTGAMTATKGMALFPRRIDGRYVMLGRQDNESMWLLTSDDLHVWDEGIKIMSPRYFWEFVQIGNCGSPMEIDEGWLVVTHGVGLVRSYCIGACLLDKHDPSKVLARTAGPLLYPNPTDRGGYVPNVVYSCGGLVHDRKLLLPYGVADTYTAFASVDVDTLLAAMVFGD